MCKMVLLATLFGSSLNWWIPAVASGDDATEARVAVRAKVVASTVQAGESGTANGAAGSGEAVWVSGCSGEGGEHTIHFLPAGGDGEGMDGASFVFVADAEAVEGENHPKVLKFIGRASTEEGSGGWLGVSIGDVSDALSDQLNLASEEGVMILNVAKDSPAEKAGLLAHDILLSIDGQSVARDVAKTVQLVRGHKPGDEMSVDVLREGKTMTLPVTVGQRPDVKSLQWNFKVPPLAEMEERITTRGHMMLKDEDGNWVMRDLHELGGELDLSSLGVFLPKGESEATQVFVDGNRMTIQVRSEEDGETTTVRKEDGGLITVTRTDADGQETTETYDDEEALAKADPDAAELLDHTDNHMVFDMNIDLNGLHLDMADLHKDIEAWQEGFGEHFREASEAYRAAIDAAREAYQTAMESWRQSHPGDAAAAAPIPPFPHAFPHRGHAFHFGAKPRQSFKLLDDGKIEVRTRKGDSELVQTYASEDDLAEREPQLYEKYVDLQESSE